jgi:hypothetical protein
MIKKKQRLLKVQEAVRAMNDALKSILLIIWHIINEDCTFAVFFLLTNKLVNLNLMIYFSLKIII